MNSWNTKEEEKKIWRRECEREREGNLIKTQQNGRDRRVR
jgi:hypothetical protein